MPRVLVSNEVGRIQVPNPTNAGEVKMAHGVIALDTTALANTDVLDLVVLPSDCVPVDWAADVDQIDSNGTPTITLDVGLITGTPGDTTFANRVVGTELGSALTTIGRTSGGSVARALTARAFRIPSQRVDRSIGIKVSAAVATAVVRNGTLTTNRGLWAPGVAYVANDYIVLKNGAIFECTTGGTSGVYGQTEKDAPTQFQPNWNVGFALTTTDGSVTWTCRTPIVAFTLWYRAARDGQ